ncbi:hypothetical protein ACFE04_016548 [Oxalis oulophora]
MAEEHTPEHEHHHQPNNKPVQHHHHNEKPFKEKHMAGAPPHTTTSYGARRRNISACIFIFLLLAGLTALIVWLIYRPNKPQFTIVSAAIYNLNTTGPPLLTSSMQFTIVTRNPNPRTSIYYDNLSIYVSYKNQQITPPLYLPPLHHGTKTTVAMSPVLGGTEVPVSPEVVNGLTMDEAYGVMSFRVVILGRLRWKAGAIKTGRYSVYVKCDVWVGLKKGFVGQVPLLGSPQCKVDV